MLFQYFGTIVPYVDKKVPKAPKSLTPFGKADMFFIKRQVNQRKFAQSTLEKRRLEAFRRYARSPDSEQQDASPNSPAPSKPDRQ